MLIQEAGGKVYSLGSTTDTASCHSHLILRVSKMRFGTFVVVSVKAMTPFILHILVTVSETLTSG
jgi:hypothetical protein